MPFSARKARFLPQKAPLSVRKSSDFPGPIARLRKNGRARDPVPIPSLFRPAADRPNCIAQRIGLAFFKFNVSLVSFQALRRNRVMADRAQLPRFTISAAPGNRLRHIAQSKSQRNRSNDDYLGGPSAGACLCQLGFLFKRECQLQEGEACANIPALFGRRITPSLPAAESPEPRDAPPVVSRASEARCVRMESSSRPPGFWTPGGSDPGTKGRSGGTGYRVAIARRKTGVFRRPRLLAMTMAARPNRRALHKHKPLRLLGGVAARQRPFVERLA
jgi:hypothetical protein